ncbi:MAG: hypothetical protein OXC46_08330 [Thaumarchaeota archaeon]|nr:hypothetical protein [Nitrososphaerota archaeon]
MTSIKEMIDINKLEQEFSENLELLYQKNTPFEQRFVLEKFERNLSDLQFLLKEQKEDLMSVKNSNIFNFHIAVRTSDIILEKTIPRFKSKSKHILTSPPETIDNCRSFFDKFHEMLNLIIDNLRTTAKQSFTEEDKQIISKNKMSLIKIAYDMKINKSIIFEPPDNIDEALRQRNMLLKSLEKVS